MKRNKQDIMDYQEFLKNKQRTIAQSGFECSEFNPLLFPFQRFIISKAVSAGKYAVFANTGLGKTIMQLEWAQKVFNHTGESVLIIAPLAVIGQTISEGRKFGYQAVKMGRKGVGIELKTDYYNVAVRNCKAAEEEFKALKLF